MSSVPSPGSLPPPPWSGSPAPATPVTPARAAPAPAGPAPVTPVEPPHPTAPDENLVVQTRGLSKTYGQLRALADLDLDIPRGSIFGMIGPNGAGKSTTFLILATLLTPTSGWATVCGHSAQKDPKAVRSRIGYMPDVMGVYENLTVSEYLEFHASAYKIPAHEWPALINGLLELVDLDVKRDAEVDGLSRGMKQRLSLARALIHDPDLLILDEPASGLDPRARVELRQLLLQLQTMGKTILVSSHILAELQQMCSEIAVIEAGRLLVAGAPGEIMERLGAGRAVRVTFADGTVEEIPVADDEAQQSLLKQLVLNNDRPVAEFTAVSRDLEDVFLAITKGIVQ